MEGPAATAASASAWQASWQAGGSDKGLAGDSGSGPTARVPFTLLSTAGSEVGVTSFTDPQV